MITKCTCVCLGKDDGDKSKDPCNCEVCECPGKDLYGKVDKPQSEGKVFHYYLCITQN